MNTAVDMSQFVAPKSDQINADDLISGPITIRVTAVSANEGSPEQPINIRFEGDDNKPFRPCKSMRRVMIHCWGADASKYVGRAMTLYRDPKVQFGGMQVGGIRISHMSHIDEPKTMALTASKAKRAPFTVKPLQDVPESKGDEARAWADTFIRNVGRAPDAAKLETYLASKSDNLGKLATERPELHAECTAAMEKRRGELAPADEDPFAGDEPTDFSGFVNGIETRILNAATADDLDAIAEDIGAADHLPEGEVEKLDALVAKKRRAIGRGA